jgi:hypothetical protein
MSRVEILLLEGLRIKIPKTFFLSQNKNITIFDFENCPAPAQVHTTLNRTTLFLY